MFRLSTSLPQLLPVERKETDRYYPIEVNQSTIDILCFIFEFKLANVIHIARFFKKADERDKHIYFKLRRMWQGQLLESYKLVDGSLLGAPIFYILSKKALRMLERMGKYDHESIRKYARQKISISSFRHDSKVVDLASLESQISDDQIKISFKGEASSVAHDLRYDERRDYQIEVFTPDYTAHYIDRGVALPPVFTEYERTPKSKKEMHKKLDRYFLRLLWPDRPNYILRFIFENESMERAFWGIMIDKHRNNIDFEKSMIQNLPVFTTNISLLENGKAFLDAVYAGRSEVNMRRVFPVRVAVGQRQKLFCFL